MKRMNISEAAAWAGCNRRTIERAIRSGALHWIGPRRGRYARGLALADVRRAFPPGRKTTAPRWASDIQKLRRWLGDWRPITGWLLAAARGGACIDSLAAALHCIRHGFDRPRLLLGGFEGLPPDDKEPEIHALGVYLRGFADGDKPAPVTSFHEAWRELQMLASVAPVSVIPTITFDLPRKRVSIRLPPSWNDRPVRGWRIVAPGFSESVVSATRAIRALPKPIRDSFSRACRTLGAAVRTRDDVVLADQLIDYARGILVHAPGCPKDESRSKEALKKMAEPLGVSWSVFLDFAQGSQTLRPTLETSYRMESFKPETHGGAGSTPYGRPSDFMLRACRADAARAFGISRAAVTLAVGRAAAKLVAPAKKRPAASDNTCRECGASVTGFQTECSECGASLI